jgi:hypothetical protein
VVGGKRYSTFLHDIFVLLASDRDEEVRQSIASQFHQVCPLLGRARCMQFLKYPLIKLLKVRGRPVSQRCFPRTYFEVAEGREVVWEVRFLLKVFLKKVKGKELFILRRDDCFLFSVYVDCKNHCAHLDISTILPPFASQNLIYQFFDLVVYVI